MRRTLSGRPVKALTILLIGQAALYYGFSRSEPAVVVRPLSQFPIQAGAWRMTRASPLDDDVKAALKADDYLARDYQAPAGAVNLFVAFFKSQRTGQTPHSPKNCLPGAGWVWSVSDVIPVSIAGRAVPIRVNRYIVSKDEDKAVVLYWYQSRDRVVASELRAAAFTAWDALRYNRTETALVRVVVPVAGNRDEAATRSGVDFIQAFFGKLRELLPS